MGGWDVRAKGYDGTSPSLVNALRRLDTTILDELIERLADALRLRDFVVRGFYEAGLEDGCFSATRAG